jgi:DNA-binding PadR family transcriptional regulator
MNVYIGACGIVSLVKYVSRETCGRRVERVYRRKVVTNMVNGLRDVETKLMKGLLDMVILNYLRVSSMHGYQIIASIRRNFGVYFGPSTVYPLLNALEAKGYIKSQWDLANDRPRKVYSLTADGEKLLSFTESSLNHICQKLSTMTVNNALLKTGVSKQFVPDLKTGGKNNRPFSISTFAQR